MIFITLIFNLFVAVAEPLPPELEAWKGWVTSPQKEKDCVQTPNGAKCFWMGQVSIDAKDDGATFSMSGRVDSDQLTPIVGGKGAWPINVRSNGEMIPIIEIDTIPHAMLNAGEHQIQGEISWPSIPNRLPIPEETGLIQLSINEAKIESPKFNPKTGLQLAEASKAQDDISLMVIRKITDGVPILIESTIHLQVSGTARAVNLGKLELEGSQSRGISSDWPVWRNELGETLISVAAGVGQIKSTSIVAEPILELKCNGIDFSDLEYWSFVKDDEKRLIDLDPTHAIDPLQTPTPKDWKNHPTFALDKGQSLTWTELRRGQPTPAPNAIALDRQIWLNFKGDRLTIMDKFNGHLNQGWRLNVKDGLALGSAAIAGQPLVITQSRQEGVGIELRSGDLDLMAVSQWDNPKELDSISWDTPVKSLRTTLHLPPGWALLNAKGPDTVIGSIQSKWNVGLLFIALLLTALIGKSRGWLQGGLVFVGTALSGADLGMALVPILLSCIALLALEKNQDLKLIWLRRLIVGVTATYVAACAWHLMEKAIDPATHKHETVNATSLINHEMKDTEKRYNSVEYEDSNSRIDKRSMPKSKREIGHIAQTGPGLPAWSESVVGLYWSGSQRNTPLALHLLPPEQRSIMLISAALLLSAAFWLFLGLKLPRAGTPLFALMLGVMIPSARAEIPDSDLRNELQKRLTEPPLCGDNCSSTPLMSISVNKDETIIRAEVHTLKDALWAIPGPLSRWTPNSIRLDGKPAENLRRNKAGFLEIRLPAGIWDIEIMGQTLAPLPLTFPQSAQQIHFSGEGYSVEGIAHDNTHANVIAIKKEGDVESDSTDTPALMIEKALKLGQTWTIVNRLVRLNENVGQMSLRIPLTDGESILSSAHKIENGQLVVNLDAGQEEISWESKIPQAEVLKLQAADTSEWSEKWTLQCAVKYRCTHTGIPPISHLHQKEWRPTWKPWPGESLDITIELLNAVDGETLTLDAVNIDRKRKAQMWEDTIRITHRASQSGLLTVTMPEKTEVISIQQLNRTLPILIQNGQIEIPYGLGKSETTIQWRQPIQNTLFVKSPAIALSSPAANVSINMNIGRELISIWGNKAGKTNAFRLPLLLIGLLAISLVLARLPMSPLRFRQWLMLWIGLSQISFEMAICVPLWILWMGDFRKKENPNNKSRIVHLCSGALVALILLGAVYNGLIGEPYFGYPHAHAFQWFIDESSNSLPQTSILTAPMWIWRAIMLFWSLWIGLLASRWLLTIKLPQRLPKAEDKDQNESKALEE